MIDLITDRTADDKRRADTLQLKLWKDMSSDEKSEWTNGLKGRYNYTDMNRVGSAIAYIRDMLNECGYSVSAYAKENWENTEIVTNSDLQNYINSIANIRNALSVIATTPTAPEAFYPMNYQKANNIEKILVKVNTTIENMIANYYYLNEIYCGEV